MFKFKLFQFELHKSRIYDPLRPNAFDLSLRHSIAMGYSILGNIIPRRSPRV